MFPMTDRGKGLLEINAAVFLFGTAGLFGKFLPISPALIVLGRVAFASLALVLYTLFKSERETSKQETCSSKSYLLWLLLISLGIILALHWLTFFHSIQLSSVAIGLLSFSTFPIYVAFLEPLCFKERFSFRVVMLAIITLFGISLLAANYSLTDRTMQGLLWGSLSGFLFAVLTLLNRKLITLYSAKRVSLYQNFFAFLFLLPFSFRFLDQITRFRELFLLILLGVVFTALSHTLFIQGLRVISARIASIIACMEPVYGIVFAVLLIKEIPELRTIAGGLIIVGTVFYISITMKNNNKKSTRSVL